MRDQTGRRREGSHSWSAEGEGYCSGIVGLQLPRIAANRSREAKAIKEKKGRIWHRSGWAAWAVGTEVRQVLGDSLEILVVEV